MKYFKSISILLIVVVISLLAFRKDPIDLPMDIGEKVKDYAIGHIAGDDEEYLVVLTEGKSKEYGEEVIVYSLGDGEEIYRKDFSELNPWKLIIGDIDGDLWDEISIGVYKKSPLHQVMAKRPFIYFFKDGRIVPKWRGSRLSRPFVDYNFYDIDMDGVDEIISIEFLEDGRNIINTYKWKGFGFEGFLESESFQVIDKLRVEDGEVYLQIKDGKDDYIGNLKLIDDNLIIERVE